MISGQQVGRVQNHNCLGTLVNEDRDHFVEIKCRTGMARGAFQKMPKVFQCHDFSLGTETRPVRLCYVFPVLLRGAETRTLTETSSRKIEAVGMWLYPSSSERPNGRIVYPT